MLRCDVDTCTLSEPLPVETGGASVGGPSDSRVGTTGLITPYDLVVQIR
jgi:hypothetical protein